MSMRSLVRDVEAFYDQVKIPKVKIPKVKKGGLLDHELESLRQQMKRMSVELMGESQDSPLHRIGLFLSEVAEKIETLQSEDRRKTTQETIDCIYICVGDLIAMDFSAIEIELAWDAVHRSNMTKVGTLETRFKTASYVPPKLDFLLGPKLEERK